METKRINNKIWEYIGNNTWVPKREKGMEDYREAFEEACDMRYWIYVYGEKEGVKFGIIWGLIIGLLLGLTL